MEEDDNNTSTSGRERTVHSEGELRYKREYSTAYCGTKFYNPDFDVCCGGWLNTKLDFPIACCGNQFYDPVYEVCCEAELYPKMSGLTAYCAWHYHLQSNYTTLLLY